MVMHTTAFYLIYVNFLGVPWLNLTCALICSFLLGLGDSAINTAVRRGRVLFIVVFCLFGG
jgi:hypothetical protein